MIFNKKQTTNNQDTDKQLLLDGMRQIMTGNYAPIDTSAFTDP